MKNKVKMETLMPHLRCQAFKALEQPKPFLIPIRLCLLTQAYIPRIVRVKDLVRRVTVSSEGSCPALRKVPRGCCCYFTLSQHCHVYVTHMYESKHALLKTARQC